MSVCHFILAEDRAQSRYLKRCLAEKGAWLNVVVGTWVELLTTLENIFLVDAPSSDWVASLASRAEQVDEAFWRSSLEVAPAETLCCLDGELQQLLRACGPEKSLESIDASSLGVRGKRHFDDLAALHRQMGQILPPDLALVQSLLDSDPAHCIKPVVIYERLLQTPLNPWQQKLLEHIRESFIAEPDKRLDEGLTALVTQEQGRGQTNLQHLSQNLFSEATGGQSQPLDGSLQWLAVRDSLQEVEVVASMIQHARRENPGLDFRDLALLIPNRSEYTRPIAGVFDHAGIPLSGLERSDSIRDLGAELVFYFLLSVRKPAPAMALASFLTSPLLPWDCEQGNELAQRVMEGRFDLSPPRGAGRVATQVLGTVRQGCEKALQLAAALAVLEQCLGLSGGAEEHQSRARELIQELHAVVNTSEALPWDDLLRQCSPVTLHRPAALEICRQGVAVFYEHEEPWRKVKQLFVLGFREGHYPAAVGASAVFFESDRDTLQNGAKLPVETASELLVRRRDLLRRQLGFVTERVHFMIPRRDALGGALQPSQSLSFMAQLYAGVTGAEDLILELERDDERARSHGVPCAPRQPPVAPAAPQVCDLNLKRDLVAMWTRDDGSIYPLSPSALETLMVSPLAWLFSRAGLEPRQWAPEALDAMVKGTLAHRVFEDLFKPAAAIPLAKEIEEQVPALLHQAIREIAPFLLMSEWRVERANLHKEIVLAATRWSEFLQHTGGRVLGNEVKLAGRLDDLPIHGLTDTLVGLPGGKIYVVDFKKSKSDKRRERMTKGYDSQATLYRIMLQTGEAHKTEADLARALEQGSQIGVLYYLMNDQVALADTCGWLPQDLAGADELGDGISRKAMTLIRERLAQVRRGEVQLNHEDDERWYDKQAGVAIYALDNSPLLRLFMHRAEVTRCA